MNPIRVTIWNEFVHERDVGAVGDFIRSIYPDGIHAHLAGRLDAPDLAIRTATLNEPANGLPEEVLNTTDVLLWWGHCAHDRVPDDLVTRIQARVLSGMGLIVLHSGHFSKVFRRLLGTDCRLRWREIGEKERVWVVAPGHPLTAGVPETFTLPHSEMYGEPFDIPDDGKVIFMSWFEGGNPFRSGVAFQRGAGRIFYFSPGHETYPIYHDPNILRVLANAIRWSAGPTLPPRVTPQPEPLEKVSTPNPLAAINTAELHSTR